VLGIGTVTGAYRFVHGERYPHQLPVRWDDTRERQVEMKGWRASLIRLNQDTFKEIEAAPIVDATTPGAVPSTTSQSGAATEVGPEGGLDFDGVLAQLASKQLSFSAELVASYLLALQAKRFVLLSGISGTGKTRLAQEIARMLGPTTDAAPAVKRLATPRYGQRIGTCRSRSSFKLVGGRPRSGRTPDRHPRENPLSATLCSSLAYLEPGHVPPESVLSRWIP
jgi:hypothetical protein